MTKALTPAQEFALALDDDNTFSQSECDAIVEKFVCAVCHSKLEVVYLDNEPRVLVVCIEHGNICQVGRVTHATVSIEMENAYKNYYKAIHALPDLWGELIEVGFEREHAIKFAKGNVCAVCGGLLYPTLNFTQKKYDVACARHGSIKVCGYIKKENYKFNSQAIYAFEKSHRR